MTYCDFKPGDEVVCVDDSPCAATGGPSGLVAGAVYVVERRGPLGDVAVCGVVAPSTLIWPWRAFRPARFRKVQRRDLGAWLETATDFEEPRRVPKKERVS